MHLERDANLPNWLDGYVITPLVRQLTARIVAGLTVDGNARAWSITGPYGSGKSAFGLFETHLLATPDHARAKAARKLLRQADAPLLKSLTGRGSTLARSSGLVAVRATGERKSLELVLLEALGRTADDFWTGRGRKPALVGKIQKLLARGGQGLSLPTREVVSLFEEMAVQVARSAQPGQGLLVILDEAGKPLEFAAHNPDRGDIHMLQELAEAANRSGATPIVFCVLLHQGFDHYATRLSNAQRNEWAKVQGRFEDLSFQEARDQVLQLLGTALTQKQLPAAHAKLLRKTVQQAGSLLNDADAGPEFAALLEKTLPLHPVTAAVLGPLFRSKLAQNERSLFAFLGANEPHGFQRFLSETAAHAGAPLLYTLDRLYDYLEMALGAHLFRHQGRVWASIDTALSRLPLDSDVLDARIVKTIGLLTAVGESAGLRPSDEVLELALCEGRTVTKKAIRASLERLRRASIIVHRRYRQAYQLWEGSDLDLDDLVEQAMRENIPEGTLIKRLTRIAPPRPIIAKRHLHETGSLRYFDVRYVDHSVEDIVNQPIETEADGVLFFAIPSTERGGPELSLNLSLPLIARGEDPKARPVIVAVPQRSTQLRELARELAALEFVQTNTAALRDDPVARRELDGRITDAERLLRLELQALLTGQGACEWHYGGDRLRIGSARELARRISDICDERYADAPHIHNELLNRRHMSSSATGARRNLMTAMVETSTEARLGMQGYPPEYSMYRSVFEQHALHCESDGRWHFEPPKRARKGSPKRAWQAITGVLANSELKRVTVDDIYSVLKAPPFGMADGVLPVLLLAVLLEGKSEIAIYEDGVFTPGLTVPVIERLLRSPGKFEFQRFPLAGARKEVFHALTQRLLPNAPEAEGSVLPIVKSLVGFVARLNPFARNTRRVSKEAQGVREALLLAREPAPLLFDTLPRRCGFAAFPATGKIRKSDAETFSEKLQSCLGELERAYPALLDHVEASVRTAFGLPKDPVEMRNELALRSSRLLTMAVDTKLKGFLIRASDAKLAREPWLVSIATLLGSKPPESWYDKDAEQSELTLGLVRRRFFALEAMLVSESAEVLPDGTRLIRISVAEPSTPEVERVVALRPSDTRMGDAFEGKLLALISSMSATLPKEALLAGLANVARDLIEELDCAQPASLESRS
ncbi:MAG: hypothetical protein GXP55_19345 [Deltaproteobacteria bacterium]|nr:hypothetical protein [Deltaproteobacteria bacterium]